MADTYQAEQKKKLTLLLREKLKELPPFCAVFFRAIENVTSAQTRVGYACDLRIFFRYLAEECPDFGRKQARDFELPDLVKVTADDLEGFMEYLTYYVVNRDEETFSEYQNGEKGKSRKLSAVRTMFTYFYKRRKIAANPSELIDMPKIHEKNIVTLEVDEIARLLDEVESGEKLT
ncbi:MAG: integrase, partial [Defluviitaleaceae bacterium]|nr:integrase [Defluviitaleaceae bacterium]